MDAGGTVTRALVTTLTGTRLGQAWAGGANPNAHGPDQAAEELARAVGAALDRVGPRAREDVVAGVIGLAGVSALRDETVRARVSEGLAAVDAPVDLLEFVGDDEVAFASGTPEPDGTILIAGTGAIAGRIEDRRRSRSADGMGWLIGDEGSAFWIGHQAARETARQLSRGTELSPLARSVAKQVIPGRRPVEGREHQPEEHARDFARTLTGGPPIALAALAPLVSEAYGLGDPAAQVIVDAAAGHLAHSVHQVRSPGERRPVVLSGGVLLGSVPMREALTRRLALGAVGAPLSMAGCTAGAAAWLAALRAGAPADDVDLHAAFTLPERGDRSDAA
ncbi:BadF/BadG/BcrA/BcrD ATPase family protein [Nocardiopsis sp. N85]|uniref:N-acetylglucosamine kinase n=1 Tax=Nocardiopsis sp. N85 TaxID=3029400 RepID=UPI00237F00C0|nr:BadF/BadG/BcrA/BcrD ATPase family protein [Nocardiopsis sp. N85]MDE3722872.1 BadF/BadG/BcrA/BcrD ATPase family protein [Nocardiopsis sp. N85]